MQNVHALVRWDSALPVTAAEKKSAPADAGQGPERGAPERKVAEDPEEALRRARTRAGTLVRTSDAHHESELGRVAHAACNAERAWVAPEQVVNVGSPDKLLAWSRQPKRASGAR